MLPGSRRRVDLRQGVAEARQLGILDGVRWRAIDLGGSVLMQAQVHLARQRARLLLSPRLADPRRAGAASAEVPVRLASR
jgi:hypothetical protein